MGSVRMVVCLVAIGASCVVAGCGAGAGTSGSSTGSGAAASGGSPPPRMLSNGIKGERPGEEAATSLHLSGADCEELARLAEDRLDGRLSVDSVPKPPHSSCRLDGRGVAVNVVLDTGFAANQRYTNRIEETVQFNSQNPAGLPRPVPHVGEKSYENSSASWIPALGSLLAVRGNRWLTVTISVAGLPGRRLRAEAAALARAGFKLSASG